MRVALFVNTPAQAHFHKNTALELERKGHNVTILSRDYGETLQLLDSIGLEHECYAKVPESKLGKLLLFPASVFHALEILNKKGPELLVDAGAYGAYTSLLLRKPCVVFTDSEPTPFQFASTLPFIDAVITPSSFRRDLGSKHIKIDGYKELAYLHPRIFQPNPDFLTTVNVSKDEDYVILRFNAFDALHDYGVRGFSTGQKRALVDAISRNMRVFISSESELPPDLERFRLKIPTSRIHDALYYAKLVVADTQTMTTEAAVLGTPAIRFNTFIGANDMGNFIELERKYHLIMNCPDYQTVEAKVNEILDDTHSKEEWRSRRLRLLEDKIDVSKFMVWFIENYPDSRNEINANPEKQSEFR